MKVSFKKLWPLSVTRSLSVFAAALACATPKSWAQTSNAPGSLRWSVPLGSEGLGSDRSFSSPAIGADGSIYIGTGNELTGITNNQVYSISPRGTTNWIFTAVGGGFRSSPALGHDGTVYVGCCDGTFYALDSGGGLKWSVPLGGAIFSSPALAADGSIYVTAISNYYNCLFS